MTLQAHREVLFIRVMKMPSLPAAALLCAFLLAPALRAADKEKPAAPDITLEDVIFDARSIRDILGPKTLIVANKRGQELPVELSKAIAEADFSSKTRLFVFPDDGTRPKLVSSVPYSYPRSLRQGKNSGHANFIVHIDASGNVRSLYCYDHTERLFALAVAASIVKWRYEPAKIAGTPVPVLLEVPAEFRGDRFDNEHLRRPELPFIKAPPPKQPGPKAN